MSITSSSVEQVHETPVVERLRDHSFNRELARLDHEDSVAAHHVVRAELLDAITTEISTHPLPDLLLELRDRGLLWSSVAEVVGVTDAAVRKWRRGQPIDPAHRQRLSRLVALARLYAEYSGQHRPPAFGEWLATPIISRFSASPLQLLALNRDVESAQLQPLLDWMLAQPDGDRADDLLDRYLGEAWRAEARAEQRFRIITNSAGERILLVDE